MSANLNPEIVARVRRGAAFLDRRVPGWRNRINPKTLDISTHHDCVMGQLCGDYFTGLYVLGLSLDDSVRMGFNTGSSAYWGLLVGRITFNELNTAWQQELAA